jgi:hypothetical protein
MSSPEKGEALRERASQAAAAFQARLQEAPLAVPQMCCSLTLLAGDNPLPHPGQVTTLQEAPLARPSAGYIMPPYPACRP